MALNIRPFYGPNFPFNHPPVSFPDKDIPLRAKSQNDQDILGGDKLGEEQMKSKVKKILEDAAKNHFKLLDAI